MYKSHGKNSYRLQWNKYRRLEHITNRMIFLNNTHLGKDKNILDYYIQLCESR